MNREQDKNGKSKIFWTLGDTLSGKAIIYAAHVKYHSKSSKSFHVAPMIQLKEQLIRSRRKPCCQQ